MKSHNFLLILHVRTSLVSFTATTIIAFHRICFLRLLNLFMSFQDSFPTRTDQKLRRVADAKFINDIILIVSLMVELKIR